MYDSQTRSKPIKKKSPWKSPFLTWISPVVLPNLTKTLGWVNKIGLHLIYQQDFKFWGFRILNHENLKTANFSGFQDSKSSIVKILKNKLLFSSWNSRFWRKGNPFSSLLNEIFSRAKILREKKSVFPLDSSLNFSSKAGEKSYFAFWLDFDQQYFADRESILKRQFCVVEQYSNFSQQKGEDGKSVKITQRL